MTDYSELKRLCIESAKDTGLHCRMRLALRFNEVLALIAENERLERKNANQAQSIREYSDLVMGGDVSLGMLRADLRVTTGERDQLKAEVEALRTDLCKIMTQINGNIRVTVRDCVNGHDDVQDIYGYCDAIESLVDAAMGKEAGQ